MSTPADPTASGAQPADGSDSGSGVNFDKGETTGGQPYQFGQPQPYGGQQPFVPLAPYVPPGMFVDPASGVVLPHGTQLASTGRRIGASFLSILLATVTLGIGYLIWGLVVWGRGQTPALQVLGMRVWGPDDRRSAGFGYMALREIVGRACDGALGPITSILSFIMMLTSKDRKSLHDVVAGTVVIYDPNKVISS